jgi:hypothetical protein
MSADTNWSIDWEWYDELIREWEEEMKNYVEPLIDLEHFGEPKKCQRTIDNDLFLIFSETNHGSSNKKTENQTNAK